MGRPTPAFVCDLQVDFDQLQHKIGSCIYCASVCDLAARETVQATLQQYCSAEVAAHPGQTLPCGVTLPRGSITEAVLQHIQQLPAHPLLGEANAAASANQKIAVAASQALITALRQCRL